MHRPSNRRGPILRLFLARAKPGKEEVVRTLFGTTSVDVVQGQVGNCGCLFGSELADDSRQLIFASLWRSLDAIEQRFGQDWRHSFLPEGYAELLDDHSVQHFDLSEGWLVERDLKTLSERKQDAHDH